MWFVQAGVLFLSLSGNGMDNLSIYNKCLPALLERMGQLVCQEGVPDKSSCAPKLTDYLVHLFMVGLVGKTIGIYHSAISEPHCHYKTSNHLIISKLTHQFYLQYTPSHNWFDYRLSDVCYPCWLIMVCQMFIILVGWSWYIICLLSLLESWALASSLTNLLTCLEDGYPFSTC